MNLCRDKTVPLIKYIYETLKEYYSGNVREVNYEDIYYLLNLLHEDEVGQTENSTVNMYKKKILEDIPHLTKESEQGIENDFISLVSKNLEHIENVVAANLIKIPKDLSKLKIIKDIIESNVFDNIFVFTLNHDIVIETYLNSLGFEYNDWFSKPINGTRYWEPEKKLQRINMLKSHGSVNWNIVPSTNPIDDYNLKPVIKNKVIEEEGFLIIGTFNKLNRYSRGVAFELQNMFYTYLEEVERLVISGYSFGDQGINSRIINWFYKNKNRNIIVIHPDPEELKKHVRTAIYRLWKDWEYRKFIVIDKGIKEVSLEDVYLKL